MKKYLLIIALAIISQSTYAQNKKVKLSEVWRKYAFADRGISGLNSMKDGLHYTSLSNKDGLAIVKYSYETGDKIGVIITKAIIKEKTGQDINFDSYQFSPNEDKILLGTNSEAIYRHSSKSNYYVYDITAGKIYPLAVEGKQQLASFSPTRNQVAFVYDNRMHIQDFDSEGSELISFGKGEFNAFIAGAVDWVYEEEFSFHKGYEWSPDGNFIAFYQTDEREVPLFSMDIFGSKLYPKEQEFKYPKAGEPNSKVSIHTFNISTKENKKIKIPEDYEYIPRIKWTKEPAELVVFSLNRLQNTLNLWKLNAGETTPTLLFKETAPCYLEINDNLTFLEDGSFIWTSEADGFNHIYHYNKKGELKRQVTKGDWPVTKFYGINERSNTIFYQSAEGNTVERSVYSIKLSGRSKTKLSKRKGWNDADFSEGFKFYVNTYSAVDVPKYQTLHNRKGAQLRVIVDNAKLQKRIETYDLATKEFFSFQAETGVELNGWMMKPFDFDETKKYPVLMFVYGGPGSQTVKNQYDGFNHFYYQTLANKGYLIVSVDNRGTGARGRDFRTKTYLELGKYETEDQIAAAKYLGAQSYIDKDRIGIWGWSYGGYMSSLCITKGADVFKMAIAVAPVTNWRFYDSVYTERYMNTPQENSSGYDDNSPINHVNKLKGSYLLVHGSADDNVHVQNTMRMITTLVGANKQFDLFIYPDKNHGIGGGNTRYHLYTKMTNFITENL